VLLINQTLVSVTAATSTRVKMVSQPKKVSTERKSDGCGAVVADDVGKGRLTSLAGRTVIAWAVSSMD
jgi:hypothetical protein